MKTETQRNVIALLKETKLTSHAPYIFIDFQVQTASEMTHQFKCADHFDFRLRNLAIFIPANKERPNSE